MPCFRHQMSKSLLHRCGSKVTVPYCALCLVAQSCLTLWDPMDCSLPGFSVHGDSSDKNPGVGCLALQGDLPYPGIEPKPCTLQADSLLFESPGKPMPYGFWKSGFLAHYVPMGRWPARGDPKSLCWSLQINSWSFFTLNFAPKVWHPWTTSIWFSCPMVSGWFWLIRILEWRKWDKKGRGWGIVTVLPLLRLYVYSPCFSLLKSTSPIREAF